VDSRTDGHGQCLAAAHFLALDSCVGLSDDITIIDTGTRKVIKSVPMGLVPYGILIDD